MSRPAVNPLRGRTGAMAVTSMLSRARRTAARRVIAASTCLVVSGCSFTTVRRVRPAAEVEDPRVVETCTRVPAAAIADSVVAAVGFAAGLLMITAAPVSCGPSSTSGTGSNGTSNGGCTGGGVPVAGLTAMVAGGVFVGSAIYGHASAAQCRRHVAAARRCANGDAWMCQKLSPGWTPPPGFRPAGSVLELEPGPASPPRAAAPAAPQPGAHDPSGAGTAADLRRSLGTRG